MTAALLAHRIINATVIDRRYRREVECIILIGLPGAGKTTFYREKFAATHQHISKDLWPNASGRVERQQKLIEETLASGKPVVVDNTNPTVAERDAIIRTARERRARVIGYFFDITTRAAVARNANRTGKGKVPNVAIFTTAKRLQPPAVSHGYDELYRIEIKPDRSFQVSQMQ